MLDVDDAQLRVIALLWLYSECYNIELIATS